MSFPRMGLIALLAALGAMSVGACTSGPPADAPVGYSTYGTLPDGQRVRLWTDTLTHTTTGTVGGESVRWKD